MSAPSASRWSAFSVRPPSASCHSVSATVSNRNAASRSARRPAGSVRTSSIVRDRPLPDRVGDLAGAVRGLAALRQPGRERLRGQAGQAGPLRGRVGAHAAMLAQAVTGPARWRCPRSTAGHAGRRPTASAGRRPAGPRRAAAARPCRRQDRARRTCRPAGPSPSDDRRPDDEPSDGVSTNEPGHGWYARTWRSSSTAGRPGSSRPSSRRSGRVSVAPAVGLRPGRDLAAEPRPERPVQQRGPLRRERSPRAPAPSRRPSSGQRSPGRRSARCRGRRPSGSG